MNSEFFLGKLPLSPGSTIYLFFTTFIIFTLLAMLCQLAFLALLVATLLDLAVNVSLNSSHPDINYYYYYGHKPFSCVIIAAETLP